MSVNMFNEIINHPEFYIWDTWSCVCQEGLYLYGLAIPKIDSAGNPIDPDDRHEHPFSIIRFLSTNNGDTWEYLGLATSLDSLPQSEPMKDIWSGSAFCDSQNNHFTLFTKVEAPTPDRPYLQSLCFTLKGERETHVITLSHPEKDYENIVSKGYFMSAPENLGHMYGEPGNSILTWRDPYVFNKSGSTYMVFAAKTTNGRPAMGIAEVMLWADFPEQSTCRLMAPCEMPDASEFTQFSVPRVVWLKKQKCFVMLCTTTKRVSEEQLGEDVAATVRIYTSKSISGPWQRGGRSTSIVAGLDNRFNACILGVDEDESRIVCTATYDGTADIHEAYSVGPRFTIDTASLGRVAKVSADPLPMELQQMEVVKRAV